MLIDTHAHIDMDDYSADFQEMLKRAEENGVKKIIIPGVEPSTFERIFNLTEKYENIYGCVGIHPEELDSYNEDAEEKIKYYLQKPKIVALGEVGLDYYWDKSRIELQKEIFEKQIYMAKEAGKPIVVHDREAHQDTFEILKKTGAKETGVVMHCFSGSPEFALQCVKEGFFIALGGVVTFKNAKKMKEVAQVVPLESLLVETDSPYLTPVPFRGKRNEPSYVKYSAEEIAKLRGTTFNEISDATTKNALKVFHIE